MEKEAENPKSITFVINDKDDKPVEVILVNEEGFFYRGEKVNDVKDIYKRFCEWFENQEKVMEMEIKRQEKLSESLNEIMEKYKGVGPGIDSEPAIG
jgi:predicted transcriptional regulator YheO